MRADKDAAHVPLPTGLGTGSRTICIVVQLDHSETLHYVYIYMCQRLHTSFSDKKQCVYHHLFGTCHSYRAVNDRSFQVPPLDAQSTGGEQGGLRLLLRLQSPRHVPIHPSTFPSAASYFICGVPGHCAGGMRSSPSGSIKAAAEPDVAMAPSPARLPRRLVVSRRVASGPRLGSCAHGRLILERSREKSAQSARVCKRLCSPSQWWPRRRPAPATPSASPGARGTSRPTSPPGRPPSTSKPVTSSVYMSCIIVTTLTQASQSFTPY
jgi:hypothetical protein